MLTGVRLPPSIARAALYAGGFLGPFGGGIVTAMLPEIGDDLGVDTGTASLTITAYLLPFALAMLVSGTLGARWGRLRTIRAAYVLYVVAALASVVAPTFDLLLASRSAQGLANAFTAPLLMAALASVTPAERLGRALGMFSAMQAAGQTSAPLVGGLAAEFAWRWAFVAIAVVALVLAVVGLPDGGGGARGGPPPRLRSALTVPTFRIAAVAALGWATLGGINFLLAYRADDVFGLDPTARGLVLTVFGVAGILTARPVGSLIDRVGAARVVAIGAPAGGILIALVGLSTSLPLVVVAWFLAGVASQAVLVGANAAVFGLGGANPGGSVSVVQAGRFGGGSITPIALTPLYAVDPAASFLVPAVMLAVLAPLAVPRTSNAPGDDPRS